MSEKRRFPKIRWWFLLSILSIAYAAGTAGSWLSEQYHGFLYGWYGWPGALIRGLAIFGGVRLIGRKRKIGWLPVILGGIYAILCDYQYFQMTHSGWVVMVLGVFPTAIAVFCGLIETDVEVIEEQQQKAENTEQRIHALADVGKYAAAVAMAEQHGFHSLASIYNDAWRATEQRQRRLEQEEAQRYQKEQEGALERERLRLEAEQHQREVEIRAQLRKDELELKARHEAQMAELAARVPQKQNSGTKRNSETEQDETSGTDEEQKQIMELMLGTNISIRNAAEQLDMPHSTLYRHTQKLGMVKNGHGWQVEA
jgi:hypothetical protein